jgi:dihydroxy-acid dehydratase
VAWTPKPTRHPAGLLAKYARLVGGAENGAVTHAGGAVWTNPAGEVGL